MKKNIYTLFSICLFSLGFSQVGIRTNTPIGVFNIDGAKDNAGSLTPSPDQQLNDVTVLPNGNVGVGTISPTQKLNIQSVKPGDAPVPGFRLEDGNQGKDKYLLSDDNGVATWKELGSTKSIINGSSAKAAVSSDETSVSYKNTTMAINLTKGKWLLNLGIDLEITADLPDNSIYWLKGYLSSSPTSVTQSGFNIVGTQGINTPDSSYAARMMKGNINSSHNFMGGTLIVNVTSAAATIYVLVENKARIAGTTGSMWKFDPQITSNYFTGVPVNE